MAKFNELPLMARLGIVLGVAALLTGGLFYFVYQNMAETNKKKAADLKKKKDEVAVLRPYKAKDRELDSQIAGLKQQLEIQKKIVPDEKEADEFINVMQDEATKSGIEIRRFTARANQTREFYVEVPFEMDVDGPYYSILNFFESVAKVQRIVNVSNLLMSTTGKPGDARVKRTYEYAPGESVVASCVATTFFSHEPAAPAPAAPAKK